jgi:hypothetical protein
MALAGACIAGACGSDSSDDVAGDGGHGGKDSGASGGSGGLSLDGGGSGGLLLDAEVQSLAFDPPTATLVVTGTPLPSQTFTLKATIGGMSQVVQADSIEFDRPDIATLTPGSPLTVTAVGTYAAIGKLHGLYKGLEAVATVEVVIQKKDVGTGIDATIVAALDAAGLAQDPQIAALLYPYDKTVFALGLASPLVMWTAPNDGDVYRLRYEQKGYVFDTYRTVTKPAQLRADQLVWDYLTTSNQGDPVKVTLSRYDTAAKQAYTSATESWTIAPESLRGAIYYWTTSGTGHLAKIQPGTGAQPQTVNGGKCMGCHAVSADGSTLVAGWEGQPVNDGTGDNRPWASFDLPSESLRKLSTYFAGTLAVNPNGKYTVFGSQKLKLGDTTTGAVVPGSGLDTLPLDPGMVGFMNPAFSPDGKKLAMIEGAGSWYHNLKGGQLVLVDFDEATTKFSNKQPLAHTSKFKTGQNVLQYPSFSPDSKWIAFDATNDVDARTVGEIWLQHVSGTPLMRLDALTDSSPDATDDNHSLEPTFNPIERGGYFWVVFTSSRAWGNRMLGPPSLDKERLWVAAIDKTIGTVDPSHPAFYVEGQEENTKNRRGFWTLAPCIATGTPTVCGAGFECCSGFCSNGACYEPKNNPCGGIGQTCQTDLDCCNAGYAQCLAGKCEPSGIR